MYIILSIQIKDIVEIVYKKVYSNFNDKVENFGD